MARVRWSGFDGGVGVVVLLESRPQNVSAEGVANVTGGLGVEKVGVAMVSKDRGSQAEGGLLRGSMAKGEVVPLPWMGVTMPEERLVGGELGLRGGEVLEKAKQYLSRLQRSTQARRQSSSQIQKQAAARRLTSRRSWCLEA